MVKWLHILTRFCLQTCWNICVRVVYWDPSECCTGWCSDALLATILRALGSISWPKHSSMHKALLTASPEQPSLMLTKAGTSFSSLQSADSFTNVFQQMCKPLYKWCVCRWLHHVWTRFASSLLTHFLETLAPKLKKHRFQLHAEFQLINYSSLPQWPCSSWGNVASTQSEETFLVSLSISLDRGYDHCATGPAIGVLSLYYSQMVGTDRASFGCERWLAGTVGLAYEAGPSVPSSHRVIPCDSLILWRLWLVHGATRQGNIRKQLWEGGCLQSHPLCMVMERIGFRQIDLDTMSVLIILAKELRLLASG